MNVLTVAGLSKSFGGVHALRDVSFDLAAGELLAMIGPNGAGKTTCFNVVNGQIAPDRGSVLVGGVPVAGRAPHRISRLGVGRTFQITATFSSMTVRENVQTALLAHQRRLSNFWAPTRSLCRDESDALLDRVGMRSLAHRACARLSYGDLKRVELAIALANAPQLLLMDEPTAGMAPKERVELMALAADVARERRIGILFTEHDMDVVFAHADRILVLDRGRLIAQGNQQEVRTNPEVRKVYLGSH
jgi:branched-chain amino acid transport system ATP-binding protein